MTGIAICSYCCLNFTILIKQDDIYLGPYPEYFQSTVIPDSLPANADGHLSSMLVVTVQLFPRPAITRKRWDRLYWGGDLGRQKRRSALTTFRTQAAIGIDSTI